MGSDNLKQGKPYIAAAGWDTKETVPRWQRDDLAQAAMNAIIISQGHKLTPNDVAKAAYRQADAMMAEAVK